MVLLDYSLATMLKQLSKEKKMQIILCESHFASKHFSLLGSICIFVLGILYYFISIPTLAF